VVIDGSADGTIRIKKWIDHQDNNVAEYIALLEALQLALSRSATSLHVFSDSELVVKQMTGVYAAARDCILCTGPAVRWRVPWNSRFHIFHAKTIRRRTDWRILPFEQEQASLLAQNSE